MKLGKGSRSAVVVAAVVVAAASGCSTKAPESSGSGEAGGGGGAVPPDVGVAGETIRLGVLTDLTGVFSALGKDITNANTLFWKDNKVCDTYTF